MPICSCILYGHFLATLAEFSYYRVCVLLNRVCRLKPTFLEGKSRQQLAFPGSSLKGLPL